MSEIPRVDKPWGHELHWAKTDRYVGKIIHINKGHALSLQYHNKKDETIMLLSGKLLFEIQEHGQLVKHEVGPLRPFHVTPGTVHRMTAVEDCDVVEVSKPQQPAVDKPHDGHSVQARANDDMRRLAVGPAHSPHDRRLVID